MERRADHLLCCAMSFSTYEGEAVPVPLTFEDEESAVKFFSDTLWYEARKQIEQEIPHPIDPHLHPVDLKTDQPGIIVSSLKQKKILRKECPLPIVRYQRCPPPAAARSITAPAAISLEKAHENALQREAKDAKSAVARAKRGVESDIRAIERAERKEEVKKQREMESKEEKKERLRIAKEEREAKKRARETEDGLASKCGKNNEGKAKDDEDKKEKKLKEDGVEEASPGAGAARNISSILEEEEASCPQKDHVVFPSRLARLPGAQAGTGKFFPSPVPFDRHLSGISASKIHDALLPSVLSGTQSDRLVLIHGPPGTGKTYKLASMVPQFKNARILACAPTNVGTCNLYEHILKHEEEASLLVSMSKVPPSTPVVSQDPTARIVCATISGAAGPLLANESFDVILIDEAAQCSEPWVWSILRSSVQYLVMAGDHEQLPAQVSPGGASCGHGRSMMERLLQLDYRAETLSVQRRMHPEISRFPNAAFYGGKLLDEYSAPEKVSLIAARFPPYAILEVSGHCKQFGSSFFNLEEVEACLSLQRELEAVFETVVLITPYQAQAREMVARGGGKNVHTVDSFQGKEADAVILSIVRTEQGGFWEDQRRLNVALTRAKHCMRIVGSVKTWNSRALLSLATDAEERQRIINK